MRRARHGRDDLLAPWPARLGQQRTGWLLSAVWPVAGAVLGVGAFVAASRWRCLRWLDKGRRTPQWLAAGVGLFLGLLTATAATGLLP